MDALLLLGAFLVFMFLGMPVAYAMGLATLATALWIDMPLEAIMLKISDGMDDFALLTIPFFVLAGAIMSEGGVARRLVDLAKIFVGFIRGGLAVVNVIASAFFGPNPVQCLLLISCSQGQSFQWLERTDLVLVNTSQQA